MEHKNLIESLNAYKNFKNSIMTDCLSQAYLFVCEDKITTKTFLTSLQLLLMCNNHTACENCEHCKKVLAGTHPDTLSYPKGKIFVVGDAAHIYDNVQVKPMLANKKVFIIENIDLATEQAQNKMLKIIEEPPQNVYFLLTTNSENKVLPTILSRVQKIYIDKIDKKLLNNLLNTDLNAKQIAISNGDGYLGKTLDIANNQQFLIFYNNIKELMFNLKNSSQIPQYAKNINIDNNACEISLKLLCDFYRDLLMIKLNNISLVKNENLIEEFEKVKEEFSVGAIIETIKRLNLYKQKLDSGANLTILVDNMLLELLEVKFLWK